MSKDDRIPSLTPLCSSSYRRNKPHQNVAKIAVCSCSGFVLLHQYLPVPQYEIHKLLLHRSVPTFRGPGQALIRQRELPPASSHPATYPITGLALSTRSPHPIAHPHSHFGPTIDKMDGAPAVPRYFAFTGNDSTGARLDVDVKAWRHADDSVWWAVNSFLSSTGLDVLGPEDSFCLWYKKKKGQLGHALAQGGCQLEEHVRAPRRALQAQAREHGQTYEPPAIGHDEYHASTRGLLLMLTFLQAHVRSHPTRHKVALCLQVWFEALVPAEAVGTLALQAIPELTMRACPLFNGDPCRHIRQCLRRLEATGSSVQARMRDHVLDLWELSSSCQSCKARLSEVVASLSDHMDSHLEAGAYTMNPRKRREQKPRAGARRQRIDEDYKRAVVEDTVSSGAARTPRALMKADGIAEPDDVAKWTELHTLQRQSAAWLTFRNVQHLGLCGDASRLGNPAEETLMMAAWSGDASRGCWLPPQAEP